MSASAVYVVSPLSGGQPYRVALRRESEDWIAEIERGEEHWSFTVAPGPAEGLARAGERPLRWSWDRPAGRLVLNGGSHGFRVQTEAEHRLAGFDGRGPAAATIEEVRAPMPGLVLAIEIVEGALVVAGQGLVVLEAMKMENEIMAPVAGVVRDVAVLPGAAVERGALLCRIAPPEAVP